MKISITPSYKKISLVFIILTIILVLMVIYFSITYTFINFEVEEEKFSEEFNIKIGKDQEVKGEIIEVDLEKEESFSSSGSKIISEMAKGEVVIINNSYRNQTLIKTTRLLSPEGILFRTAYNITVPSKGKTKVEIYADKTGKIDLAPTKFTIPGLQKELQILIYGQSLERIRGGGKEIKIVKEEDFKKAEEDLKNKIKGEVLEKLKEQLENYNKLAIEIAKQLNQEVQPLKLLEDTLSFEIISKETKSKIGEEKDKFDFKIKLKSLAIAVNEKKLENLLKDKISKETGKDKEFFITKQSYLLENYDLKERRASLKTSLEGEIKFKPEKFEKEKLINKKKEDLENYFKNFKEIKNIKIKNFPFFIERTPFLKDHIIIKIKSFVSE